MTLKAHQPPKALIFDMDGVLVDSEPLHKRAKELAFGEIGLVLPEAVYDSYKGRPDATMIPEVLGERGLSAGAMADEASGTCGGASPAGNGSPGRTGWRVLLRRRSAASANWPNRSRASSIFTVAPSKKVVMVRTIWQIASRGRGLYREMGCAAIMCPQAAVDGVKIADSAGSRLIKELRRSTRDRLAKAHGRP